MKKQENEFHVGQEVFIQGFWRAVVRTISGNSIGCDVYEGLSTKEVPPQRYHYAPFLLEKKRMSIFEKKRRSELQERIIIDIDYGSSFQKDVSVLILNTLLDSFETNFHARHKGNKIIITKQ